MNIGFLQSMLMVEPRFFSEDCRTKPTLHRHEFAKIKNKDIELICTAIGLEQKFVAFF